MGSINNFFEKHGNKIIVILLIIIYFKSCTVNLELGKLKKEKINIQKEIDTIGLKLNKLPNKLDLKIEGLKSEKRMIQATDRKIYDVNRQNQIEVEIKELKEKNYEKFD